MPGLFSLSLPVLFYLIDPKSDLVLKAHVADVDTKMLAVLLPVFGLKISGREDEFLPYWEKYGDAPGGWTKIFLKQFTFDAAKAHIQGILIDLPDLDAAIQHYHQSLYRIFAPEAANKCELTAFVQIMDVNSLARDWENFV